MSILIKGMEIPKSCRKCHISQPDGCGFICPIVVGKPIVDSLINSRHPRCPLVSATDVRPRGTGRWEWTVDDDDPLGEFWKCNLCGERSYIGYNFCPNCGADMRVVSVDG